MADTDALPGPVVTVAALGGLAVFHLLAGLGAMAGCTSDYSESAEAVRRCGWIGQTTSLGVMGSLALAAIVGTLHWAHSPVARVAGYTAVIASLGLLIVTLVAA